MNTYTINQLYCMTNKLNIVSKEWLHRDAIWHCSISQHATGLKRIVYIYSRTVGSIEFLERSPETNEFVFTVADIADEYSDSTDIYDIVKLLKLD